MPKLGEMTIKFPPPKILMYGPPGCGKTALGATFGEGLYVIDIDDSLMTCFTLDDKFKKDRLLVEPYDAVERQPTQTAVSFIKTKQKLIEINNKIAQKTWIGSDGKPLQAVMVDGLSFLCDAAFRYIMYNVGKLGREMAKSSDPRDAMKNNASQPEWGLMINEVEQVIQLMRALPVPVILTAHSVSVQTPEGMTKYEIAIPTQKLPPRIPGYFDEVWYLDTNFGAGGVVNRVVRTILSPVFVAKSRGQLKDGSPTSNGMRELLRQIGWTAPQSEEVKK